MLSILVSNLLHFVSGLDSYSICPKNSSGNGKCELNCMNSYYNYDSSFYSDNKYEVFKHSDCFTQCDCDEETLTNGKCDIECSDDFCGHDLGDCGYCNYNCFIHNLESDTCFYYCASPKCRYYESNPCNTYCAPGCSIEKDLFLDGICKDECLVDTCLDYYFNTSCRPFFCDINCYTPSIGNGDCDGECYNLKCNYDGGDCNCSIGCHDTLSECGTNETFKDPCDTESCRFKDGKCGYCASGCFEQHLGDGICQAQCNTVNCNYDYGDCRCAAGCSYKYNSSVSQFIQTSDSNECSDACLVLDCQFGIGFCTNLTLVKSAVLNFMMFQDKDLRFNIRNCENLGCKSEDIINYLNEKNSCIEESPCNIEECLYCMGETNISFENCLKQTFKECKLCGSAIVEGTCYKDLTQCPNGYKDVAKLAEMFGNSHWCLRDPIHYSRSYYKESYVDSSVSANGIGTKEDPAKSLYHALVNVYAAYTKIFLVNKTIDFMIDDSSSIFLTNKNDPLNVNTLYNTYELWIIGNYSETEKTTVYWKDNLLISPISQKFFLKNIELIGKYVLDKNCVRETCFYCPYVYRRFSNSLWDDNLSLIWKSDYKNYYAKNCSIHSKINVFTLTKEAYFENVRFADFRYQFNSFIKSSGVLYLKNVEFSKMQAKADGSIILLECVENCTDSLFIYNQGLVSDIGAGYNNVNGVQTGSFIIGTGLREISITNVTFSFNFILNYFGSASKAYLLYIKNYFGTIYIENCYFYANYVNYLVYIDISSLIYSDYQIENAQSIAYSQQHFYMNDIIINSTYCSNGMLYYLMDNFVHNIKITNLLIKNSMFGKDGILSFINRGELTNIDINGDYQTISKIDEKHYYIYLNPRFLKLENIKIEASLTGKNSIYIENYPNSILKNISISNIKEYNFEQNGLEKIIALFFKGKVSRYLRRYDYKTEKPELDCNEMVYFYDSVNLLIDNLSVSNINCPGLLLEKTTGIVNLSNIYLNDMNTYTQLGNALIAIDLWYINIINLTIYNINSNYESIVKFDNCYEILIDSVKIINVTSNYVSTFVVTNSAYFFLSNFSFIKMTSNFYSGGCLALITGTQDSSYIIKLGEFNECRSETAMGGAVFLENLTRIFKTVFKMYDVLIHKSYSIEGSAVFISNNVAFSDKENSQMVKLLIKDNDCKNEGIISDYHQLGNLKIDDLVMINNTKGIYVLFSNEDLELHILNSKIDAANSQSSALYFNSVADKSSVYIQNVEIMNSIYITIEAFNFEVFINQVNISNIYKGLFFNNKVKCEAISLKILNAQNKAIILDKNSVFVCNECKFSHSKDLIIEASSDSKFYLSNSKIFANTLNFGNLLSISSGYDQESILINCEIYSNSLNSGSLVYLFASTLTMNNSIIVNNQGYSTSIQVVYSYNSIFNIFDSKLQFNTNVDKGALLYAISGSRVTAENSIFENSQSKLGIIYGSNVEINITNCTFSRNIGGDIFTIESKLIIRNSKFENSIINSPNSGVVGVYGNNITIIEGSIFESTSSKKKLFRIAYVYCELSYQLKIFNCKMKNSKSFIMGVFAQESTSIIIQNSILNGFIAEEFSALASISIENKCKLSIIDSKITENMSNNNGGGVYSENCNLIVEGTEISNNSAEDSGGGIYFNSPKCNDCGIYLLGTTKIFNNFCKNDGGAIKWNDFKPYRGENVLIYNNSAVYGSDLASVPAKFGFLQSRKLSDLSIAKLSDVAPGKKFKEIIQVIIYDTYGQHIKTENSIAAKLMVNDTSDSKSALSGVTTFKAQNGIIYITDFTLTGIPGSSVYLKLKSDNMKIEGPKNDDGIYSDSAFIQVQFRNCTRGEQIQASACIDCISGKYTLDASENCLKCPTGASCTGGDSIIVNDGYWRSSLESDVIYACDVYEACIKGSEENQLGNCSQGYTGVLCKSCEIGYSKTANSICTKCPNEKINFVIMVLLFLGIGFLSFVLVKTTLTSAFSPKSLHSIYIKILTNYLQLIFIVTQFDLEWPSYVIRFFNLQRITSSVSDQLFSIDCFLALRTSEDIENLYYTKLIIITAVPIGIAIFSYLYWIFYSYLFESYKSLKREVYTTIIVLFFLVYPNIVKFMFSNFSCLEIDKMKSYLNVNTSIECWDLNHKKYSFIVVIPSIILWVLGVPTALLILMTKNKRRLHLDYYRVVFGFLYNGYKHNRFYWEIHIMYRKILLITITVFKISQARVLQALNLIIILLASIYIHHSYKPYISRELNSMEMQALNIAAVTIYFGLYYLSKSIGNSIQILLFIFIIIGNCYFILYWIYYMARALIDIFIKIFPRFKSLLKRGDAFDEEFYREEIFQKGVFFNPLEGENAYTFINLENKITDDKLIRYRNMEDAFADAVKRDIRRLKIKREEKI